MILDIPRPLLDVYFRNPKQNREEEDVDIEVYIGGVCVTQYLDWDTVNELKREYFNDYPLEE